MENLCVTEYLDQRNERSFDLNLSSSSTYQTHPFTIDLFIHRVWIFVAIFSNRNALDDL